MLVKFLCPLPDYSNVRSERKDRANSESDVLDNFLKQFSTKTKTAIVYRSYLKRFLRQQISQLTNLSNLLKRILKKLKCFVARL